MGALCTLTPNKRYQPFRSRDLLPRSLSTPTGSLMACRRAANWATESAATRFAGELRAAGARARREPLPACHRVGGGAAGRATRLSPVTYSAGRHMLLRCGDHVPLLITRCIFTLRFKHGGIAVAWRAAC